MKFGQIALGKCGYGFGSVPLLEEGGAKGKSEEFFEAEPLLCPFQFCLRFGTVNGEERFFSGKKTVFFTKPGRKCFLNLAETRDQTLGDHLFRLMGGKRGQRGVDGSDPIGIGRMLLPFGGKEVIGAVFVLQNSEIVSLVPFADLVF